MTRVLVIFLLMATAPVHAAEAPATTAGTAPQSETAPAATPADTPETPPATAAPPAGPAGEPPPESAQLKQRRLGDAFRRFRPSEEISADNAVPFPVDI